MNKLEAFLDEMPDEIKVSDIQNLKEFEARFFEIERVCGDIVGWNEDTVEFCPNEDPLTPDEILPWVWLIRPDLEDEIKMVASDELIEVIDNFYGD